MTLMSLTTEPRGGRWYRSFYFRIGFSFVIFVVIVLVAQSIMFSYLMSRRPPSGRSPNNLAAIVAADVGSAIARAVAQLLSLPGTLLLVLATIFVAAFIFEPARRRLRALEHAAKRLGSGDLSARAPETGGDEVAYVAAAFNGMAADLAARDE